MADRHFLDWPFFEPQHRELALGLEAWAAKQIAPFEHQEDDVDTLSRRFVRLLGEGGWLRHCVPAAYGGARDRLDVRTLCVARETLALLDEGPARTAQLRALNRLEQQMSVSAPPSELAARIVVEAAEHGAGRRAAMLQRRLEIGT